MVICLEWGADLHIAQLMPLPLTVSCFSKIQTGFVAFLVPAHPDSPGQRAVKWVCVCVLWTILSFWRQLTCCASITKQYNLLSVHGRWCPAAGKVTVGLHWPFITDFIGLSVCVLKCLRKGDEHPTYTAHWVCSTLYFYVTSLLPSFPVEELLKLISIWRSLCRKRMVPFSDSVANGLYLWPGCSGTRVVYSTVFFVPELFIFVAIFCYQYNWLVHLVRQHSCFCVVVYYVCWFFLLTFSSVFFSIDVNVIFMLC